MTPPTITPTILVADDARLAAIASSALAVRGSYLPVIDGPRMTRDDRGAEVIRRVNAIARSRCRGIVLAGLSPEGLETMSAALPPKSVLTVCDEIAARLLLPGQVRDRPPIIWGRDRIGLGLLRALRAGTSITFEDRPSPKEALTSISGHMVVCEAGDELSEVIAANYAYALNAGLVIIPSIEAVVADRYLDDLYHLYDRGRPVSEVLESTCAELRELCSDLTIPAGGSVTFFTRTLPLGLAFPEAPSTHLFTYPDLGLSVINGFASTQQDHRGDNVAILVDPETTEAPEIEAAAKGLSRRGMFVRAFKGAAANVRDVCDAVELYPYNLLVFATHCGDAKGHRRTYAFEDSEGHGRKLVVDIALGIGRPDEDDRLAVTRFIRFHELDGIGWHDPEKKKKLYVGTAIKDFMERIRGDDEMQPIAKTSVDRVAGSAAMAMSDNNYIPVPRSLADKETPVILNNACVSWHELAGRFTFAGARAYVGTLIPVTAAEAQEVVTRLLDCHFDKALPHALWSAQQEVYGTTSRRPYVMTGVYPQRLQPTRCDTPAEIIGKLSLAKAEWRTLLKEARDRGDVRAADRISPIVDYYSREHAGMVGRWTAPSGASRSGG